MNNVENPKTYNVVVQKTNKILSNSEQNSIMTRPSISQSISPQNINKKKEEIEININKQIQITPIEKITYDSYIESDILNLLYFFKSYIHNIKIVCHSHLMQDLLNIKILNNFD
jgi:hypothetical protein